MRDNQRCTLTICPKPLAGFEFGTRLHRPIAGSIGIMANAVTSTAEGKNESLKTSSPGFLVWWSINFRNSPLLCKDKV